MWKLDHSVGWRIRILVVRYSDGECSPFFRSVIELSWYWKNNPMLFIIGCQRCFSWPDPWYLERARGKKRWQHWQQVEQGPNQHRRSSQAIRGTDFRQGNHDKIYSGGLNKCVRTLSIYLRIPLKCKLLLMLTFARELQCGICIEILMSIIIEFSESGTLWKVAGGWHL